MAYDERVQLGEHGARIGPAPSKELLGPLSLMWHRVLPRAPHLLHPDHQPVPTSLQRRTRFVGRAGQHALQTHPEAAVVDRREGGCVTTRAETEKARDVVVRGQRGERKGEGFFEEETFFGE